MALLFLVGSRFPRRIVAGGLKWRNLAGLSTARLQISSQGVLPRRSSDPKTLQAFQRKNRVRRSRRRTCHLRAAHWSYFSCESLSAYNLAGKFEPRTVPAVGRVHNSAGVGAAQLNDRLRQICSVGGAAALIVHHIERGAAGGQLQDRIRETFPVRAEQP